MIVNKLFYIYIFNKAVTIKIYYWLKSRKQHETELRAPRSIIYERAKITGKQKKSG